MTPFQARRRPAGDRLRPRARATLGAMLGVSFLLPGIGAADTAPRHFDLPAGDAAITLKAFATQSDEQLLYSPDDVRGVQTRSVRGSFTPVAALEAMLEHTTLRIRQDATTRAISITLRPPVRASDAAPSSNPPPVSSALSSTMKPKNPIAAIVAWLALAATPAGAADASLPTGSIEGRVVNATLGTSAANARVTIDALGLETFTDETGRYMLPRVPARSVELRVTFTGLPAQSRTVTVAVGQRAVQDFELGSAAAGGDGLVRLDAFKVAAQRDMAASDVAVNEQRYAAEIKNVVSTDSFADIADGNVGEFAKYLPGVTLNRSGSDGLTLSIGGVPPGGTPIMMDGNGIANAAGSNANRQVEFENIAVGSLARVEVSRSQNPDTPANAIGGSVNLISRSAFERSRPQYTVKTHLSFRGPDFSLEKEPGPFQHKEYVFLPNLEFSAVVPVTRNFGFTASALATRTFNNGPGIVQDWVPTVAAQSANFPATTPDKPYLVRYRLQERPKITERNTVSLSADWRVNATGVLTLAFQYTYFMAEFWVRQLNFDVGRAASFGDNFTQGANGAGFVQILTDAREKNNTAWSPSLRYKHNGPIWQWQVTGAYSAASNNYSNEGYFLSNNAFFRNVTIRFDQLTEDHPNVVSVRDAAGVNAVNPYDLSNYRIEGLSGQNFNSAAIVRTLGLFARREFQLGALPLTAKVGADLRSEHRDLTRPTYATTYLGPNRVAADADNTALPFFDPSFSSRDLKFGPRMQWFDLDKVGEVFRTNREQFTNTDTEQMNAYRSGVTGSQAITETILAPYLRLDTSLLEGRLQFTGGVRYERTEDEGNGPLIDPGRIYQRNAAGQIVRNPNGTPVVIAPLATLAGSRLAYIERGTSTSKSYDDFFPSVNGSFKIMPNLIARASFGRAFNRPDFGNILPTINLPDPEGTARTITATNPALKPWYANSYGVSLEYYFNEPSTGVVSVRAYRRDITDFWGTALTPATDELLDAYGVDPSLYGSALGYLISTTRNAGDARVTGTEFDFRQNLTFLPRWARGFTVFGNATLQSRQGGQQGSLSGFVKKTFNWGVTFSRDRYSLRLAVNHRGKIEQGTVTNAGAEPGTTIYLQARAIADLSAEYRLTRRYGLFVTGRNVNSADEDTVRYGRSTPANKIIAGRINYGATWYVGVKGTF